MLNLLRKISPSGIKAALGMPKIVPLTKIRNSLSYRGSRYAADVIRSLVRIVLSSLRRLGVRVNGFRLIGVPTAEVHVPSVTAIVPASTGLTAGVSHCHFGCHRDKPLIHSKFLTRTCSNLPVDIVQVEGGYSDARGLVVSARGELVNPDALDQRYFLNNWETAKWSPKIEVQRGRILNLSHRYERNYFHWLFDIVPRLAIAERAGISWDYLHVAQDRAFQRETLQLLQIPADRIISTKKYPIIHGSLTAISWWDAFSDIPGWACTYLRERFTTPLPSTGAGARRWIYVSRRDAHQRRVLNEAEVEALLSTFGVEIVTLADMPLTEQIRLFSEAEVVMGPHGAGLANMVFCPEGSLVIELSAPRYVMACWYDLARKCGHKYYFVGGPDVDLLTDHGWQYQLDDFLVDTMKLRELLEHIAQSEAG